MNRPNKISVIMGIYNCESTLEQAITSIQKQTYTNWELIMCDDGSVDETLSVAKRLAADDSRLTVLQNGKNCGLNKTLNRCLKYANGEFIARMDGDDDCLPERFEEELNFLLKYPEYDIVSTPMLLFDENGVWGKTSAIERPQPEDVVCGSPICHAPVMLRRECMDRVCGYTEDERMIRVEDVNLWIKLYAAGYRCYNLQKPLYRMRNDKNAFNRRKYIYRINSTYVRLKGCRALHLGPKCYFKAFYPMVIGLVPNSIRRLLRKTLWGRNR